MRKTLKNIWIWFDYEILLPLLAFMPQKIGRHIASVRGTLYFHIKRDWRSFTFGDMEIWNRTYSAYKEIFPNLNHIDYLNLVKKRYEYQSIEEFESALLIQKKYHKINVKYIGLESIENYLANNPHVVFTTAHFGSIIGLTFLKILKIPVLHMGSNVIKQKIVHPSITKFYIQKYIHHCQDFPDSVLQDHY